MHTTVRIALVAAVVALVGTGSYLVGASRDDGPAARFAVEVASMPGVDRVSLSGSEVRQVSLDREVAVDEVLAVRDRLEDEGVEASVDVAGVAGRWGDLEAIAPTMIAVAEVVTDPGRVRIREVGDGVWIEATLPEDATPADGAAVVLRILQELADQGVPDGVEVVGANTPGQQLDLVFVGPDALQSLDDTVVSLAEIDAAAPAPGGKIECEQPACEVGAP